MDDDKFISKWKPKHEKKVVRYLITVPLSYMLIVSIITSIVIWIFPRSETDIDYLMMTIGLLFLMFMVRRALTWFSGEKRYRNTYF